jgi:hypothetical protein
MNIVILGCGGVGGRVADLCISLPSLETLTLVDGDTFEEKNLDRQLGVLPGSPKVQALRDYLLKKRPGVSIETCPAYVGTPVADDFLSDKLSGRESIVVMAVDNYAGRRRILETFHDTPAWPKASVLVYGGNEYWDGHAIAQIRPWKGTKFDFRVRYPETLTRTDPYDPAKPSCTELAQISEPQLALTNATVATMVAQMVVFYSTVLNEELSKVVSDHPEKPLLPFETWVSNGQFTATERAPLRPT